MPKIAKKGSKMPESPIRKLVPYAEKAKSKGIKVLHLNIGQPDIKTPKNALDKLKSLDIEVIEYSHSAGNIDLRREFSKYYNTYGLEINEDNIMVTTGGSEALSFVFNSIMDDGDQIIIPEPFYANYNGFSVASGVEIVPINSAFKDNFSLPPISEFEKKINSKTKAILICNPNNPTGYVYSNEELEQLKSIALKHDLFLIADEVYREFVYDSEHTSILSFPDLKENAIVVDSVSKRFSLCGARIGCIVSRNVDFMSTALKFGQARLSPPTLAQIVTQEALNTPPNYFSDVISEYKKRRDILVSGLEEIENVEVSVPKGAFYCIAKLPVQNAEEFSQWLLESFQLDGETVMLAPASGFYSSAGLGGNQVRIAYVLNVDSLKRAIKILKNAIVEYNSVIA